MTEREEKKRLIMDHILPHVPFEGWSSRLLEKAASEAGLDPSYGWRLFPKGVSEVISYWSFLLDQEMLKALPPSEGLKVREKVALGVKTRLSLLKPHREAARKTVIYLALPPHIRLASGLLYQTVNEIWYYAGDRSTDYNFYTKRGLLALVYSSTLLYWLQDKSQGFEKTWNFLEHRIENVLKVAQLPQKLFSWKHHG